MEGERKKEDFGVELDNAMEAPRKGRTKTAKVRLTAEVIATHGVPANPHRRRTWLKTKLM